MILSLKAIQEETEVSEVLERDWWPAAESDQILGIDVPLHVRIKVAKVDDKFLLEGKVTGGVLLRCDRCLDSFHWDLASRFHLSLLSPKPGNEPMEVELLDDDMEVEFVQGEAIDLDRMIMGQIYLSLPMKSLCKEGCLGLCPACGVNLNVKRCECAPQNINPAFEKLKNLKP
jgi:uncharacterized protein